MKFNKVVLCTAHEVAGSAAGMLLQATKPPTFVCNNTLAALLRSLK